jgi:hypothetical protein
MGRRGTREARILGLWTAGWLGALLLAGLLWVGDLSLQWPALAVPVIWALVAARPRGGRRNVRVEPVDPWNDYGYRTDTVEQPALRPSRRRNEER